MKYPDTSSEATISSAPTNTPTSYAPSAIPSTGQSLGTIKIIRTIGYGLLVLALLDIAAMIVPFDFKNPVWEFQRFGELVERSAVPLIGLAMVFYGENLLRKLLERRLLKIISWAALLAGIGFVLLIPIAVSNANRITVANLEQLSAEYSQQQEQADQIEQQINSLPPDELADFLASQGQPVDGRNPEEVKETVLGELTESRQQLLISFETAKREQQRDLLSDAVKWSLGAVVSGVLFVYLWVLTPWARKKEMRLGNKSPKPRFR